MHLIIDGYNLLHAGRNVGRSDMQGLQRERGRLISRLSDYRRQKLCDVTVVFDGWQGGEFIERKERERGIDLVFTRRGETADEVIKRMVTKKGAGAIVITSDREIAGFAQRFAVSVIPSEQFLVKIEQTVLRPPKEGSKDDPEERGTSKKGPSKRLSKKERRKRAALRKI